MNPQQQPDDPIKHVVLLMFENHSFDQMLGCFKQVYPGFDGVDPKKSAVNSADGTPFSQIETSERQMTLDPRHEVNHVLAQMKDHNSGFVADFVATHPTSSPQERQYVMGYYPLDFLPALHRLAREFLICDHWFSAVPRADLAQSLLHSQRHIQRQGQHARRRRGRRRYSGLVRANASHSVRPPGPTSSNARGRKPCLCWQISFAIPQRNGPRNSTPSKRWDWLPTRPFIEPPSRSLRRRRGCAK
jgi:hypothetical protein